ncbi:Hsp20/alpha crystallin family protein [Paenibacillus hamazuiensis]|uniref:Hsp20/alpha crystallin family protein n=1 Tax=Paenibacillus hamazuiensis TaxID=2936508 RepID=UPI00200EC1C4|nr:Hsp20/alpha crystallin family protein [Paenibacillus hamazuiensis]
MDHPKALWNAIQNQAGKALGEEFWQEISRLIPNPGPRVDVYQTAEEVVVVIELPGLRSPESIKMSLSERHLLLKGELAFDYPVDEEELILHERFHGKFQRKVLLPSDVELEGVSTGYRQGLLTVRFRKKPMTGARQIPLNSETWET